MKDELREEIKGFLKEYWDVVYASRGDDGIDYEDVHTSIILQACESHWRELVPKDHIVTLKTDYLLLTGMNIE